VRSGIDPTTGALRDNAVRAAPLDRRRFLRIATALPASIALAPMAALLAGCGRARATLDPLPADAVILAFGDSLTYGTGAGNGQSYPAQLERLVGRKVVAAGVPGEVTASGLARLPAVLEQVQPKLVILCHGGNDLLRRHSEAQAAENIRAMIRLVRGHGAGVVLIGVPKPGLFPSTADFYGDIATEFATPYEEDIIKKVLTDNALKSDPIHPNSQGYARIAEALAGLLKSSGAL
jgi:acyl-CoA thioesterase-1